MAKIEAVWAIDIGQAGLKALKLVPGEVPEQAVAEAFDYVEYPKILSQPDADPEELVREALATFLGRNDVKGSRVAIGVPGQSGLVKFIKLPPVERKRIPDIVKFEARQQIPFALEEVIWDYQQIGADSAEEGGDEGFTMAEVGLFAMKRDQINRAILPFRIAGIEVDIVQMGPIALYNFAAFDMTPASGEPQGSIVLLDVGADNTDLIITDGTRIWQRNVPIGGNHFTRALTKELKLTFAKAEHLKRNATKAPDPRAVFTAMRGVFNDFSSEVNRSIGFYSSVNRQAKILKVVGLGNGFKLPGLQKFLQQNLSYEVDKLETFNHLVGEEVVTAPQFQENLPSFAVAYGLAVQALDRGPLKTNLLPPEIEQVRMIRRKKPWALAAAALLMIGFGALFLGDWSALAKVDNPPFAAAVSDAKAASKLGARFQSDFDQAKTDFNNKLNEGKALVGDDSLPGSWPRFLQTFNKILPDPARELKLDPTNPKNEPVLSKLRVHIDAVKPVWRTDLAAGWFNDLPDVAKNYMLPIDRDNPPKDAGWVIQVVGHHYNPSPIGDKTLSEAEKAIAKGPAPYLVQEVLPRFYKPELRAYGIHHVALAWMGRPDYKWVSESGVNYKAAAPLLGRATPPTNAGGGGTGAPEAYTQGGRMAAGSGMMGPGGMGMMPGMMGSSGGMMPGMMGSGGMSGMSMMPGMMGMRGGRMGGMDSLSGSQSKNSTVKATYLTRTDFMIQFAWQPPAPDAKPNLDEISKQLTESLQKLKLTGDPNLEKALVSASEQLETKTVEKLKSTMAPPVAAPAPGAAGKAGAAPAAPGAEPAAPGSAPGAAPASGTAAPAPGAPNTAAAPAPGSAPAAGSSGATPK
jgi:type IV pilus assembly protein PilM